MLFDNGTVSPLRITCKYLTTRHLIVTTLRSTPAHGACGDFFSMALRGRLWPAYLLHYRGIAIGCRWQRVLGRISMQYSNPSTVDMVSQIMALKAAFLYNFKLRKLLITSRLMLGSTKIKWERTSCRGVALSYGAPRPELLIASSVAITQHSASQSCMPTHVHS